MKNYLKLEGWNEHFEKMENLADASGGDMFCLMNYVAPMPYCEQVSIFAHANSFEEIAGYLRYRVVRDMIWIVQKNPDFEPEELDAEKIEALTPEQKELATEPLHFWKLLGECFEKENWKSKFLEILEDFNNTFPHLDYCTYSFRFFHNADELREYFVDAYSEYNADIDLELKEFCSVDNFDGTALQEYIEDMFC